MIFENNIYQLFNRKINRLTRGNVRRPDELARTYDFVNVPVLFDFAVLILTADHAKTQTENALVFRFPRKFDQHDSEIAIKCPRATITTPRVRSNRGPNVYATVGRPPHVLESVSSTIRHIRVNWDRRIENSIQLTDCRQEQVCSVYAGRRALRKTLRGGWIPRGAREGFLNRRLKSQKINPREFSRTRARNLSRAEVKSRVYENENTALESY